MSVTTPFRPEALEPLREAGKRIVMIYGYFNVLHPGHFRFIQHAAEQGDVLVVGLFDAAGSDLELNANEERLHALACVQQVDFITIIGQDVCEAIRTIRPHVVVKGREWENAENPESELLESMGATLHFSSGERFFSAHSYLRANDAQKNWVPREEIQPYLRRHNITYDRARAVLDGFAQARIAVLGDVILDEYQECLPVGMSREDPTLVVTPLEMKRFVGGAGIVAAHARSLGASVDFYSVVGEDEAANFVTQALADYGVDAHLLRDPQRPTTVKRRYRALNKSLLRINDFSEHDIPQTLQRSLLEDFAARVADYDMIIFSDFNYGFLPASLVQEVGTLCAGAQVPYVADSQSSSQVGDLAKFKHAMLITPTEHEARLTINNTQDGLVALSEKLGRALDARNIFVTLGPEGVLIRNDVGKHYNTDEFPALNLGAVDVAGAGDAMLASAALTLAGGEDIWTAAFIGSLASGYQVGRVGNIPLRNSELAQALDSLFGHQVNYP